MRNVGAAGGAVAKSIVFGNGERDDIDDGGTEPLLERISDGVLADDRRSAASELRDLVQENPVAQAAIGSIGLTTLLTALRDEREDSDLVQLVLEVLVNAITAGGGAGASSATNANANANAGGGEAAAAATAGDAAVDAAAASPSNESGISPAGAANAEALAKNPTNVELLLSLLDESDFYVRYHAVQLLTALSSVCAHQLRSAIMSNPMGVGRLMDMMLEREVIRNETLLLLISLTRGSEDLRKIVAFEGAFERCFNVVREEGAADGGIIVQDCLELCNNLLRGSPSNQTFFRDSSFLQKLPEILQLKTPPPTPGGPPPPPQKAANLLCALELVTLLVSTSDAKAGTTNPTPGGVDDAVALEIAQREATAKTRCRAENQTQLAKFGTLDALLSLCLGELAVPSVPVRVFALRCLGDLVAENRSCQDLLFAAEVNLGAGKHEPALLSCLRAATRGNDAAERAAAEGVFARVLRGNTELQLMCISTIAPTGVGVGDGDVSLGGFLARALVGKTTGAAGGPGELSVSCHAAAVLRHMLDGNAAAKAKILTIPLELPTSAASPPELLLPRIVRYLSAAVRASSSLAGMGMGMGMGVGGAIGGYFSAEKIAETAAARRDAEILQAVLLRLLISWLHGCADAVNAFLAPAAHLPMLADLARGGADQGGSPHVAGLASVLLGCCLACDAESGHVDAHAVLDVITSRVGLNEYFGRWEEMRRTREFVAAAAAPTLAKPLTRVTAQRLVEVGNGGGGGLDLYDHAMASFIVAFEEDVKARVISIYARPKSSAIAGDVAAWEKTAGEDDAAHAVRLKSALKTRGEELAEQRARNAALAEQLMVAGLVRGGGAPAPAAPPASPPVAAPPVAAAPGEGGEAAAAGAAGAAAAAAAAAEAARAAATKESGELKAALEQAKAAAEDELRRLRAELEDAKAAAASSEENLRSLSEAYNGLEATAHGAEEEAKTLREQLAAATTASATAVSFAPAAPATTPSPEDLLAAKEEGRREAVAEMAKRLEETAASAAADVAAAREDGRREAISEMATKLEDDAMSAPTPPRGGAGVSNEALQRARDHAVAEMTTKMEEAAAEHESELSDLLICLGQEESKREALYARLVERHGEREEDLEVFLEECVVEDEDDEDDED